VDAPSGPVDRPWGDGGTRAQPRGRHVHGTDADQKVALALWATRESARLRTRGGRWACRWSHRRPRRPLPAHRSHGDTLQVPGENFWGDEWREGTRIKKPVPLSGLFEPHRSRAPDQSTATRPEHPISHMGRDRHVRDRRTRPPAPLLSWGCRVDTRRPFGGRHPSLSPWQAAWWLGPLWQRGVQGGAKLGRGCGGRRRRRELLRRPRRRR